MGIRSSSRTAFAVALAVAVWLAVPGRAEEGPFSAPASSVRAVPSQAQLDQLLAPIALYPDDVLGSVLTASTYPLEVVALHRWLEANSALADDARRDALAAQPWDESVKSLAAFPQLVSMMDGQLDWTQALGDAFLASQADVMDTVQRLRRKASAAGNLQDNERARVVDERGVITIEPAAPDMVYVPVYDPWTVYGPWWWPGYPPYAWGVTYFGPWDYFVGGLYFGAGFYVGGWHDHSHPDWHGHRVEWQHHGGSQTWRHDSSHRGGVPYVNPGSRQRYDAGRTGNPAAHQEFRGFDARPHSPAIQHAPQRPGYSGSAFQRAPQRSVQPQSRAPAPSQAPAHAFSRPSTSPIAPAPSHSTAQQSQRGHSSLGSAPSHSRGH